MVRSIAAAGLTLAVCLPLYGQIYPEPIYPRGNPPTPEKTLLGELLFSEPRLSVTGNFSCASCHDPKRHFADGLPRAIGATGEEHSRNTPTLYNVAFNSSFGWDDAGITELEQQHLIPLTNENPLEMGYTDTNLADLLVDTTYKDAFEEAFPGEEVTTGTLVKALATYVRTIRAPQSPFDEYLFHDRRESMTDDALRGMDLFFSERLGCSMCHASFNFSGPVKHEVTTADPVFHVTGVNGSSHAFRAPTLRQVVHTAPYMHDGSVEDLRAVLHHYQTTTAERVPGFTLTDEEEEALIAFLESL